MSLPQTVHVRVIDRLGGGGKMSRMVRKDHGRSHTVCGDEATTYDVSVRDARKMTANERAKFFVCETCCRKLGIGD